MASASNEAPCEWSWHENKTFELALFEYPEGTPDRWSLIAAKLSQKNIHQVIDHYRALLHDLEVIESGRVEPPNYRNDNDNSGSGSVPEQHPTIPHSGQICFESQWRSEEKRKSIPWTEEEHRLFLKGLAIYGKGDWKNISRYAVVTKTPTQVASHAQKFFIRQEQNKESKRKSIHDITDS